MNIPEGMAEVSEEHYMHNDILEPLKVVYGLVQAVCCWFKEYIKTMALKAVL